MREDPIVIASAARTPMGGFQGDLSSLTAGELGAAAISSAVQRAGLKPQEVQEVIMGCVLAAGQGQAPARQAALGAQLAQHTHCTTINKMCGSGMQAVMFAHDQIKAGSSDVMIAGGMESMSNAPYLLPKARGGMRMGHGQVMDHMFLDGLEDAYDKGKLMGAFAEATATRYQFTRAAQDAFAIQSLSRAQKAIEDGTFSDEIAALTIATRGGEKTISTDEQPHKARLDKIPQLKPAFAKDGTVTAANSSSISDGAAALLLMRESEAQRRALTPLARIIAHAGYAHEPEWFSTAPIYAMEKLLKKIGKTADQIDLYEINEAFAVVTLAAIKELRLPEDKVNVHGGACALGHPIGASGARILVTLLNALAKYDLTTGIGSLCIGGGEAVAVAVERIH